MWLDSGAASTSVELGHTVHLSCPGNVVHEIPTHPTYQDPIPQIEPIAKEALCNRTYFALLAGPWTWKEIGIALEGTQNR